MHKFYLSSAIIACVLLACKEEEISKKDLKIEEIAQVVEPEDVFSENSSQAKALEKLKNFIKDDEERSVKKIQNVSFVQKQILLPQKGDLQLKNLLEETQEDTLLYLVNFENDGGYAILDARNEDDPIIAVTEQGSISPDFFADEIADPDDEYAQFKSFLSGLILNYSMLPDSVKNAPDVTENNFSSDGITLKAEIPFVEGGVSMPATVFRKDKVGPLLKTDWHQYHPYNKYTPYVSGPFGNSAVGCVAVALGQIVAYNQFPATTYFPTGDRISWSDVNRQRETQSDFVARVLKTIADLCKMKYGKQSSSDIYKAKEAMKAMGYKNVYIYPYDLVLYARKMLREGKPVYVQGNPLKGPGHAWVIDGYQTYQEDIIYKYYVHCVWGWEKELVTYYEGYAEYKKYVSYNGYYRSKIFEPGNQKYNFSQQMLKY